MICFLSRICIMILMGKRESCLLYFNYLPNVLQLYCILVFCCLFSQALGWSVVCDCRILCSNSLISIASFLWDVGKQRRPRSDTATRGVWSGSPLFTNIIFYQNLNKKWKIPSAPIDRKWTFPIYNRGRLIHISRLELLDQSISVLRVDGLYLSFYFSNLKEHFVRKQWRHWTDATYCGWLRMSHKKDAMLIWVDLQLPVIYVLVSFGLSLNVYKLPYTCILYKSSVVFTNISDPV